MISLIATSLRSFSRYRHGSRHEGFTGTTNPSSEGGQPYYICCKPVECLHGAMGKLVRAEKDHVTVLLGSGYFARIRRTKFT